MASDAYFAVSFNTPADYNLDTGLTNPTDPLSTTSNASGINNSTTVYRAVESTSMFKAGKFTQELKGTWVTQEKSSKTNVITRESKVKADAGARNQSKVENAQPPPAPVETYAQRRARLSNPFTGPASGLSLIDQARAALGIPPGGTSPSGQAVTPAPVQRIVKDGNPG